MTVTVEVERNYEICRIEAYGIWYQGYMEDWDFDVLEGPKNLELTGKETEHLIDLLIEEHHEAA